MLRTHFPSSKVNSTSAISNPELMEALLLQYNSQKIQGREIDFNQLLWKPMSQAKENERKSFLDKIFQIDDNDFIEKIFTVNQISNEHISVAINTIISYTKQNNANEKFKALAQIRQIIDLEHIANAKTTNEFKYCHHKVIQHPETFAHIVRYHYAFTPEFTGDRYDINERESKDFVFERIKVVFGLIRQLGVDRYDPFTGEEVKPLGTQLAYESELKAQLEEEAWHARFRLQCHLRQYEHMTEESSKEKTTRVFKIHFLDYLIKHLCEIERKYDETLTIGNPPYFPPMREAHRLIIGGLPKGSTMSDTKKWFFDVVLYNTPAFNWGKGSKTAQILADLPNKLFEKVFEHSEITHQEIWEKGWPDRSFTRDQQIVAYQELLATDPTSSLISLGGRDRKAPIALGSCLSISEQEYVFIKPKGDGKNQSPHDGFYALKTAYDIKSIEMRDSFSAYKPGELFFLKMLPKEKSKRAEGFAEILAGNLIKSFINQNFIHHFFKECFVPADVVQLPDNAGMGLITRFLHNAIDLFKLKKYSEQIKNPVLKRLYLLLASDEKKNAFFEAVKRGWGETYEIFLNQIDREQEPFHGLSYILLFMIVLGNYSVHSGNIFVSQTGVRTDFFGIDYGASFRYFMETVEQKDIFQSLEETHGSRWDGWRLKSYMDHYAGIDGLKHAIVKHAENLLVKLSDSDMKTTLRENIIEAVTKTLTIYRQSIAISYGPETWPKEKERLFQYVLGKQYTACMPDDIFAYNIAEVIFRRISMLVEAKPYLPDIKNVNSYSSAAPSIISDSARSSIVSSCQGIFSRSNSYINGLSNQKSEMLLLETIQITENEAENKDESAPLLLLKPGMGQNK